MNRKYNLKLDLQFRCNNSTMKFDEFDNNTSDFFIRVTNGGNLVDVEKAIVVLAIIKPSGKVSSQFVEVENGLVYADLKSNMKDEIGTYTAKAMLILEDERVVTDVISYEVEEDKIFSLLNDTVETAEDFTLLTDMLNRLSTIEISEEQRVINEAERILSEENRKIEEAKRVEAELIRQHEEADRAKYDATRESNENIRKQNEEARISSENVRLENEAKRVEEEAKRAEAEQLRKDNYNFMTEDEDRRRSEANSHKEAENLRVQAETNRVNEEAKRRTTEQARVSAENTRVSNENTRKANEATRQNNETKRVETETQRQNRYNSFIADAEANASNFENYTNSAKIKEEERKSNELNRKSQEDRRVSNEVERISNENTRKANENAREKNETSRQNIFENKVDEVDTKISELNTTKDNFVSSVNTKVDSKISELDNAKSDMTNTVASKVNEVENRFNALTSKQQQDAEVIDARDGETSLKARLDRDIEKAKEIYAPVEGSSISTDSSVGYLKDIEILGNTIQNASNLADIRSVGDKVEGQELYEIPVLSRGKNLWNPNNYTKLDSWIDGTYMCKWVKLKPNTMYTITSIYKKIPKKQCVLNVATDVWTSPSAPIICNVFNYTNSSTNLNAKRSYTFTTPSDGMICLQYYENNNRIANADLTEWINEICDIQLEEGTQATPYEPYQEDKLTILSPTPLEKVGDVRDRIIEKDGVWGVEKNVGDYIFDTSLLNLTFSTGSKNIQYYAENILPNALKDIYSVNNINSFCPSINRDNRETCATVSCWNTTLIAFAMPKDMYPTITDFKNNIPKEIEFRYILAEPQFIPLPHDQQVKLRTFANKTNISFLTKIEGTIKAQVPKSIGATVNTHTEQINNLNKELDRVKKLEESTVSTVTTESDFTTVEQTSNGYFEDVKLEGKTLVNLYNPISINPSPIGWNSMRIDATRLEREKEYTFVINNLPNGFRYVITTVDDVYLFQYTTSICIKFKMVDTKENYLVLHLNEPNMSSLTLEQMENLQVIILEGDHTQNPPSGYIEGLKSVGQDVDEISVESVKGDGNLFDDTCISLNKFLTPEGNLTNIDGWFVSDYIKITGDCYIQGLINIASSGLSRICVYDKNKKFKRLLTQPLNTILNISQYVENNDYIRITEKIEQAKNVIVCKTTLLNSQHQADKKRLLYYNNETQTWEKPMLREWDSIEKHANGKYYYHQRSGAKVLNGSENWNNDKNSSTMSPATYRQSIQFNAIDIPSASFDTKTSPNIISDLLPTVVFGDVYSYNRIGISISGTDSIGTHIIINNNFINVTELKQWLQANNLTVVYQLAEEKVYECTNIDLITYNGETNFIVNSGAITPRTTLKVHNNISNVVSLLQKKVSLLESNITSYMITQNRLMLASRYNADNVTFKVDYPSMMSEREVEIDYDLFKLIQDNIIVGPENYDVDKMLEIMDLYAMIGFITWEMWDYLYEVIDSQINPVIGDLEGAPEI